ncbi:MAG: hypothetical protein FWG53_02205 [Clostridiales bacterium]|nr:hypothetical protein [Clostridiales bacterium]
MFDSDDIARRALRRADEIKADRKRMRKRLGAAGTILSMCAVVLIVVVAKLPTADMTNDRYLFLDNEQVPLAALQLPDDNARPFTEIETANGPDYALPGYETVTVPAETTRVEMALLNPEGNSCLFTFEVVLKGMDASLYESGMVAPGMCIENFSLLQPLPKGEHKAAVIIRAYMADTFAFISKASVEFTLIAE